MDQERNGRPNLKRHGTLQRTPTFASLLCELRAQRPDLVAEWTQAGVGLVMAPIFTGSPEVVAAEFGDKVLARHRFGCLLEIYSPFLGRVVFVQNDPRNVMGAARIGCPTPRKPRKTAKKRAPKAQRAEAA
jgi:hypothetical protein